jgi:pimeloyl-ACP methyl ester carboxylesterase
MFVTRDNLPDLAQLYVVSGRGHNPELCESPNSCWPGGGRDARQFLEQVGADLRLRGRSPGACSYGDDDRVIPPAQTRLLHQAQQAAGADSTHYLLSGAGHGRLSLSRRQASQWTSLQLMTVIKDFLGRHLRT